MGTRYSQLSFAERVLIGLLRGEGLSNQKIAVRLGRVASTIGRELRRNAKPAKAPFPAYDGTYAHKRAAKRRRDDCRCKLARQPDLQKRVGQDLAMGYSPEQICGRLTQEHSTMQISPESIYRFAYYRQARQDDYWRRSLPQARSKRGRRKRGGGATMKSFKDYVSIEQRPAEINTRETPGHWEADQPALAKAGGLPPEQPVHPRRPRTDISQSPCPPTPSAAPFQRCCASPEPRACSAQQNRPRRPHPPHQYPQKSAKNHATDHHIR